MFTQPNSFNPTEVINADNTPFDHVILVSAAVGNTFSVAVKDDGTVWTWGADNFGQLGNGQFTNSLFSNPGQVINTDTTPFDHVISVTTGPDFTLSLKDDGTVWGWGANFSGLLGDNQIISSNVVNPVEILNSDNTPLDHVISITSGFAFGAALIDDGTVRMWGDLYSRFGSASLVNPLTDNPSTLLNSDGSIFNHVIAIAAGHVSLLALKDDGTVWSVGYNGSGQLGNGSSVTHSDTPVQVTTPVSTDHFTMLNLGINDPYSSAPTVDIKGNQDWIADFSNPSTNSFVVLRIDQAAAKILDPANDLSVSLAQVESAITSVSHPTATDTEFTFAGGGTLTLQGMTVNSLLDSALTGHIFTHVVFE